MRFVLGPVLFLALLALFVPACDSEGDPDWTPGTSPLRVKEVHPDGASGNRLPLVYVVFNHQMNRSSIVPGVLVVRDETAVIAGTVEPLEHESGPCIGVSFRCESPLGFDTCYTATVTTAVLDNVGSSLDDDHSWTFCVDAGGAYAWQEPETFEVHSGDGRSPTVAMDAYHGLATVVWVEQDGATYNLWRRSMYRFSLDPSVGAWDHPALIESDTRSPGAPHAAANFYGHGIALGPSYDDAHTRHWLSIRRFEFVFRENEDSYEVNWVARHLRGDGEGPIEHPQGAVDLEGDSLAVFEMLPVGGSRRGIYATREISGPSFSDPELLHELADGTVRRPRLAINPQGNAFAIWEAEEHSLPYHLYGARYDKDAAGPRWVWNGSLDATAFDGYARSPAVAMDGEDNAIVVWNDFYVRASHHLGGTDWSERATLSRYLSIEDATRPRVAIDMNGRAVAVWQQQEYGPIRSTIRTARYE